MALSDKLPRQDATATATAPTPATPAKAGANTKTEQFKQDGANIRSQYTDDQKALEGSKSDKVAFVCALGDPNKKQARVEGKQSIDSYAVVGYKFKALEDMTVPFAPIKEGFKSLTDVEPATEKPVKAGEVFALNLVETAQLISRIEYAGKFCGEDEVVVLSVKASKSREELLPILSKQGAGSIKSNMELIAEMQGVTADSKGTPVIKPEFADSFGKLYVKKTAKRGTGTKDRKAGEGQANIAAAFRNLYASK